MNDHPVKYIFNHDTTESRALVGNANRVMSVLENLMEFQGLDQYSIQVTPYPGALIIASKVFGARKLEILVGTPSGDGEAQAQKCLCTCNFTVGWILKKQDNLPSSQCPLYTVMACHGKRRYVMVENVLASDFTRYYEFFPVVMIPYYQMAFLCCSGAGEDPTGCRRVEYTDAGPQADAWRTSLRIIPWCAVGLPKWRPVNG